MKNTIVLASLMVFSIAASESPQSSPDLRNSIQSPQDQDPLAGSPRMMGLKLSGRMQRLNSSLNLDLEKLLASANTNSANATQITK